MVTPNWSDFTIRKTTADGEEVVAMERGKAGFVIGCFGDGKVTLDAPNLLLDIGAELKKRPAAAPKAAAAAPAAAPKAAPKAGPKAAAAPADGRPPLEAMGLWARPRLKQAASKITFLFARVDEFFFYEFFFAHVNEQLCYLLM